MSVETPAPGERQGDLATSTRSRGKTINFGLPAPDPYIVVRLAPVIVEWVRTLVCKAGADRVVSEIGPWMLADRQGRAQKRQAP